MLSSCYPNLLDPLQGLFHNLNASRCHPCSINPIQATRAIHSVTQCHPRPYRHLPFVSSVSHPLSSLALHIFSQRLRSMPTIARMFLLDCSVVSIPPFALSQPSMRQMRRPFVVGSENESQNESKQPRQAIREVWRRSTTLWKRRYHRPSFVEVIKGYHAQSSSTIPIPYNYPRRYYK